VFEAVSQSLHSGVIALDDIYIRRNTHCSDLVPTTAVPTTEPTSPPASSMDCNFQEGKKWMSKRRRSMGWWWRKTHAFGVRDLGLNPLWNT